MSDQDWEAKIALLELRSGDILVVQAPPEMIEKAVNFISGIVPRGVRVGGIFPEVGLTIIRKDAVADFEKLAGASFASPPDHVE